jgi:hypothetical protein
MLKHVHASVDMAHQVGGGNASERIVRRSEIRGADILQNPAVKTHPRFLTNIFWPTTIADFPDILGPGKLHQSLVGRGV